MWLGRAPGQTTVCGASKWRAVLSCALGGSPQFSGRCPPVAGSFELSATALHELELSLSLPQGSLRRRKESKRTSVSDGLDCPWSGTIIRQQILPRQRLARLQRFERDDATEAPAEGLVRRLPEVPRGRSPSRTRAHCD